MLNAAQLQIQLIRLLREYSGAVEAPPNIVYSGECHERLTRQNIIDGVCLMSRFLGMSGSAGDVDLYRLNLAYLQDPVMQQRLNDLLHGWQHL